MSSNNELFDIKILCFLDARYGDDALGLGVETHHGDGDATHAVNMATLSPDGKGLCTATADDGVCEMFRGTEIGEEIPSARGHRPMVVFVEKGLRCRHDGAQSRRGLRCPSVLDVPYKERNCDGRQHRDDDDDDDELDEGETLFIYFMTTQFFQHMATYGYTQEMITKISSVGNDFLSKIKDEDCISCATLKLRRWRLSLLVSKSPFKLIELHMAADLPRLNV